MQTVATESLYDKTRASFDTLFPRSPKVLLTGVDALHTHVTRCHAAIAAEDLCSTSL